MVPVLAMLPALTAGCADSNGDQPEPTISRLESVTRSHTRVVWLQDAWERNDVFSDRGQLRLMGLDSRDRHGERIIIAGPAPLRKPLFTPCGRTVVYTDGQRHIVRAIDWEGDNDRELAVGTALAVWRDPQTDTVWVYAGRDQTSEAANTFRAVVRFPLETPRSEELVWNTVPVGRDNFQLSADGQFAAGMFPWPDCGIADLSAGDWTRLGRGCWTAMAPDNSYRMWMLDGAHRTLTLFESGVRRRKVSLAQAPGIENHEVYHPRWSNHPRFMAMTGPYKTRHGGNNIRGGGESVEVHVGRFNDDFSAIESWVQVTANPHANFFPDVWIADVPPVLSGDAAGAAAAAPTAEASGRPVVEYRVAARLVELSPLPAPADLVDYDAGLVANAYAVDEVIAGDLPHQKILVAHWAVRDRRVLPTAQRIAGRVYRMRLHDYDARADLEGERLVVDVDDLLLPIYFDAGPETDE